MKGILEAKSKDGTSVKIKGKLWIDLTEQAQKFAKNIETGAEVEYETDGSFIREILDKETQKIFDEAEKGFKTADKVKESSSVSKKMADCLIKAEAIYHSEVLSKEFKEKLDWTKISISMFIAEMKNGRR